MKIVRVSVIFLILLSFLDANRIVFGISNTETEANRNIKIITENIKRFKEIKEKNITLKINKVKLGDKWLLVSDINDPKLVSKIGLLLKKLYPGAILLTGLEKPKPSFIQNNLKLIVIALLGFIGILSTLSLLFKIGKVQESQDELENRQIDFINKNQKDTIDV